MFWRRGFLKRFFGSDPRPIARLAENAAGLKLLRNSVLFEYVGASGLGVIGPVSRLRYRFACPGATAEIDRRDAVLLDILPNLRRLD